MEKKEMLLNLSDIVTQVQINHEKAEIVCLHHLGTYDWLENEEHLQRWARDHDVILKFINIMEDYLHLTGEHAKNVQACITKELEECRNGKLSDC